MARRRMISQELVFDEEFNVLSFEAQSMFLRMLAISDDCGVVPATYTRLRSMTNLPTWNDKKIDKHLKEILNLQLGLLVEYNGKPYFIFKIESFARYQSYIINKRQISEYLKISADSFDGIDWKELTINCISYDGYMPGSANKSGDSDNMLIDNHMTGICSPSTVESRKQKVESRKQKVTAIEEQVPIPGEINTPDLVNAWTEFQEHRKEIKKELTTRAKSMMLKKLCELSDNNAEVAIKILEQSIANGWQGIFELKGSSNGKTKYTYQANSKRHKSTTADDLGRTLELGRYRDRQQRGEAD